MMTTLEIPEGVTSIGQDAFDYCTNLASLTIPASVTSIGVNAFMECDALTSVTVAWVTPLNISSIYLFYGCDNLSTATLYVPNGTKGAYSNASYGWNVFGNIEGYGEELSVDVEINETNFPDANFRYFVRDKAINTNEDDYLSEKEVLAVTKLSVGSKEISNMKGIEYFTALQELICGHNHGLTSLNVSANKALTKLDCSACGLTSLNVSQNTALKELICYNNSLTSLDVSTNTALELLRCEYNTLTSLTVSKTNNTALKDVYCGGNQISGAAMTNLVNGLPTVTGDHGFNVCDDTQKTDNVITPAQVKTATDKGWMVLKFNGSWASQYAGYGDVDGDNKINQNDVTLTVNIIMGQKPATVGEFAGDLNHDGKTDAADIVVMNNILNGFNAQQQIDNVQEQNSNNKLQ